MFQSLRVARPQDALKAPKLVSLLSSSAPSYLDPYEQRMFRAFSEVADLDTRLGPAGRYVDPVFQHSSRFYVAFTHELVKTKSVRFVEEAVEHVGLFFSLPRRSELRGSSLMCVQVIDIL